MGPIEGLRQADLVRADIFSALALSDEAGWNQVAEDWALFIDRFGAMTRLNIHVVGRYNRRSVFIPRKRS